jgi:Bacterial Ig-like domain
MKYSRPLYLGGLTLLLASSLAVPMHGAALAVSGAAIHAGANGVLDFDTTLTGLTSDKKDNVSVEVARNPGTKTVEVTISVNGSQTQGSTYKFDLPSSDLVVNGKGAKLDTHKHLGAYGHITAQWIYTSKSKTIEGSNSCTPGISSTVTRILATGSAQLSLSFPCDGNISAQLHGKNLDIDNGNAPGANSRATTNRGLTSIYFTGAFATRNTKTGRIGVGAYQMTGGPSLFFVSIGTSSTATTGLVSSTHFASDTLPANGLTTGTNPAATLQYSGALGSATLQFTGKGQSFSFTESGACVDPSASTADQAKSVSLSTSQTAVSGPVNLVACTTAKTTFGAGDSGVLISTSPATTTAPTAVPGTTPIVVPTIPTRSGTMSVVKLTPADGATGVSTSTPISVTLSATPKNGQVTMILMEADNPAGVVVLPPATYDPGTMTATTTPATPLTANTKYKLTLVAVGASGGFVSSSTTFTTGSS